MHSSAFTDAAGPAGASTRTRLSAAAVLPVGPRIMVLIIGIMVLIIGIMVIIIGITVPIIARAALRQSTHS